MKKLLKISFSHNDFESDQIECNYQNPIEMKKRSLKSENPIILNEKTHPKLISKMKILSCEDFRKLSTSKDLEKSLRERKRNVNSYFLLYDLD